MKCPNCRQDFDPREAMMDEEWREILGIQPKFGEHARLVFEYCELFGVSPLALKTKKLLRLLQEVSFVFESKRFSYQKREYEVSIPLVVAGLRTVCNKHFAQPLENHNYLKRVLITLVERIRVDGLARRERELREMEAGAPRAREESENRGDGESEKAMTAAEWKRSRGIESLAAKVGRKIE